MNWKHYNCYFFYSGSSVSFLWKPIHQQAWHVYGTTEKTPKKISTNLGSQPPMISFIMFTTIYTPVIVMSHWGQTFFDFFTKFVLCWRPRKLHEITLFFSDITQLMSKYRGCFQIVWPSQNIWTLCSSNSMRYLSCTWHPATNSEICR